jgi:hypothetical protein
MALLTPIGSKFLIAATDETPLEVGEVVSISGPNPSVEALDTSSLTDSYATRIAGRTDWGTITVTINVTETTTDPVTQLYSDLGLLGGAAVDWEITIPCADCASSTFKLSGLAAICGQVGVNVTSGTVVQTTLELNLSGDVTLTS